MGCLTQINNVGYNHCHDADFYIDRPNGSEDNMLLLLKTPAIFTISGRELEVAAGSFILYRAGRPQAYRCLPKHTFSNDWIHFLLNEEEEAQLSALGLPFETPVKMESLDFLSFCVKSIAHEVYSDNLHKQSNICHYMFLLFNKVSEQLSPALPQPSDCYYEMLSTVRNKIYSHPNEERTVDSTAHEVRMSKSNFQHLYKKYFNITFMQDLIHSRIEYAKMLLYHTNLSSEDVSKQCGYNNYAHFARQFKRLTGVTPMDYRRLHSELAADE